ncbi:hypothetical protein [Cobetia sp. 5-25-4-2]|uniref:hypothetical protein n=1 Tax=Cobetia sp. 5-25-4-2 TaxID=2737459 RepID=UPI001596C892|nr:hypothetical protein [Cobetia sp. 5-25-4-2]
MKALHPTPEQHIQELEKQLEFSQQKAQFFEAVVNVLEKDYGISVKIRQADLRARASNRAHRQLGVPVSRYQPPSLVPGIAYV